MIQCSYIKPDGEPSKILGASRQISLLYYAKAGMVYTSPGLQSNNKKNLFTITAV
jgi:hypothetical protein